MSFDAAPFRASVSAVLNKASRGLRALAAFIAAPAFVVVVLLCSGAVCAVLGVSMLAGNAWALICAALILFTLAWLLLRGVSNG